MSQCKNAEAALDDWVRSMFEDAEYSFDRALEAAGGDVERLPRIVVVRPYIAPDFVIRVTAPPEREPDPALLREVTS